MGEEGGPSRLRVWRGRGGYTLFFGGPRLCRHGPLVAGPRLQPLPIGLGGRSKLRGQAQVLRQQPQVVQDYTRWFLARLRAVESALAHNDHLCAGRFTAADVAVGYALLLAQHLGLAAQFGPATQAYWQRLQARPGYQRAMAAQTRAAEEQGVPTTPAPDTQP